MALKNNRNYINILLDIGNKIQKIAVTFEHVGVKAPGTPIKIPFLPANKSVIFNFQKYNVNIKL